jgi:hypothetical protein
MVNASLTSGACRSGTVNGYFVNVAAETARETSSSFLTGEDSFYASGLRSLHEVADSALN